MTISIAELQSLMTRFIDGQDRSLAVAQEIEVNMEALFGEQEPFASTVLALASYRPGGGELLYSEADLVPYLVTALRHMAL